MYKWYTAAVASVLFLVLSTPGWAAPTAAARQAVLQLDPATTKIEYSVNGWPHHTHGLFKLENGIIRIDPATDKAAGQVVVSASSGNSGAPIRDANMRDNILEVQHYPNITFTPQWVEGHATAQGTFPATVHGILTVHGQPHEVALAATIEPSGENFVATTHFVVPYVAWGMKDPSILMFRCDKTVNIDITAHGHVTWATAAADKSLPSTAMRPSALSPHSSLLGGSNGTLKGGASWRAQSER